MSPGDFTRVEALRCRGEIVVPHGLTKFDAKALVDKAQSALELLESTRDGGKPDGDNPDGNEAAGADAMHETLRVVLENQMRIAETLDLIKKEFDKFEEGLGKIL